MGSLSSSFVWIHFLTKVNFVTTVKSHQIAKIAPGLPSSGGFEYGFPGEGKTGRFHWPNDLDLLNFGHVYLEIVFLKSYFVWS